MSLSMRALLYPVSLCITCLRSFFPIMSSPSKSKTERKLISVFYILNILPRLFYRKSWKHAPPWPTWVPHRKTPTSCRESPRTKFPHCSSYWTPCRSGLRTGWRAVPDIGEFCSSTDERSCCGRPSPVRGLWTSCVHYTQVGTNEEVVIRQLSLERWTRRGSGKGGLLTREFLSLWSTWDPRSPAILPRWIDSSLDPFPVVVVYDR